MGTGIYNQNHHHHHKNLHQRNGNPTSSSSTNKIFLPILCRLSVKDTIAPHPKSICPKKNDPSSPKVSCMGQVKRQHHNHHHHLTPSSITNAAVKHHHKIFSGNNKCVRTIVDQRRRQSSSKFTTSNGKGHDNNCAAVVPVLNLAELDPPLPVIKRLPSQLLGGEEPVSLWKRRSREDGLTNLQIPTFQCTYSIQTPLQFGPPTSV